MDAAQLSRWTRFASKGGIGKCIALQDCVAREPDDLMFLKDDEITVLMQLPNEDGIYLGYCEGVVGRFAAAYVQFNGKLKTPVITKRSSFLSKSPRPRSLTPSRKRPPSQGSAPSISRAPSRAEDPSAVPRSASPTSTVPNHLSPDSQQSPILTEPSHHDSLVTSSTSYSSSSSSQDSPFPPTPSDSYVEPLAKDKTVPDLDPLHVPENDQTHIRVVPLSSPQQEPPPDSPRPPGSYSVPTVDPLDTARLNSQPSVSPHIPPLSPSKIEPGLTAGLRVGANDATSDRMSRVSAAMSDGVADIGLSMLQGFGNADDDDDDGGDDDDGDEDEDGDDKYERTSLEEAVDGFPAPPTQIPTASQATPLVLDVLRPPSTLSEYSEDGDGASFYDNYRYSRLSISSKMSKSSAHTLATVPPPVPTSHPSSVRHSLESLPSMPTSPLTNEPMPSSPPSQGMISPPARLQTRTIPPPLTLGSNSSHTANPSIATTASPLLHTNFTSPLSSPPTGTTIRSPMSPVFDFRGSGSGAASALRLKIESDRARSSPLSSPLPSATSQERTFEQSQSIVVTGKDEDGVPSPRAAQPRTPTSPAVSTATSSSDVTLEKKRGVPPPLVVMNQAPPPPYTATSPLTSSPLVALASPTYSPMPSPVIPRISPQPAADAGPSESRKSLFLPHPNAPKPSVTSQGPLYWRSMPPVPSPPSNGLIQTLRRASHMRVGPTGLPLFSTIYGSTMHDLSMSVGPVPIFFSTDPPIDVPANRMRVAISPAAPPTLIAVPPLSASSSQGKLQLPAERHASTSNLNAIPRTNFVPKAASARPRSRSFSGFDSPMVPGVQPKKQSRDEASVAQVARPSSANSESEPSPRPNSLAARAAAHTTRIHQARQYTPSPLALTQATVGQGQGQGPNSGPGSLPSPASFPPSPSRTGSSPISPTTLRHTLKPMKSEPAFRASQSKSPVPDRDAEAPTSPTTLKGITPPSIQISTQESRASLETRQQSGAKTSMDVEGSHLGDSRSQMQLTSSPPAAPLPASASGSSLARNTSLRSKISLSALRSKSLREQDDGLREGETVQVMDTDFELVRPTLSRPRASEDSSANGKSSGSEGRPSFLRLDSPATSLTSGGASDTRSPVSTSASIVPPPSPGAATPTTVIPAATVEAHRALELKWVAAMAVTPSAVARKNKKIRRLLQEGVPASVRYQVWAHLADSRAKRIEGLYSQLGERGRVPAFADIQRDAQDCFAGDKRLAQPNGPLVSLLQSYLTMVPDIQYSKGLAFIAGQLLLQSPEEDAFWIFISLMDTHLRPYFSSNSVQLDIDASLFAKAVESIDPQVAKKLFADMGIAPIRVCRPWFTSLFVEALPTEYFQRVWDIFLSEGVVFLFRIGLALVTCCHRTLRDIRTEADALAILARPPPFLLSSSPSALIELSSSFRIKDDDIRKQRVKLEAQVKRQTQTRLSNAVRHGSRGGSGNGLAAMAITLPSKS